MAARDEVSRLLEQLQKDELALAEGVRRLAELQRKLPEGDPLRAQLAPMAELDERFTLALAGYDDMASLTEDIRRALEALRGPGL